MTVSGLQSAWTAVSSRRATQTLIWYSLSAFIFCEVYMASLNHNANLGLKDIKRAYERPRLNERTVLFRSLSYTLALTQSIAHIYFDLDCVRSHSTPAFKAVRQSAGVALQRILTLTIITSILGFVAYFLLLRNFVWSATYSIVSCFYSLAKSNGPTGLTDSIPLMGRFLYASMLLGTLWEITNQSFTVFAGAEPMKHGQPLTSESRDQNGSLINGLKAKNELTRYMAFTELALIAERFGSRRRALFQDVDRKGGPAWSQIFQQCSAELQVVIASINNVWVPKQPSHLEPVARLPKVSHSLRQDDVVNASPRPSGRVEALASTAGSFAKSLGQSQNSPKATKMIEYGSEKILGDAHALGGAALSKRANQYVMKALMSAAGSPFRAEFSRRANLVVFGERGQIDLVRSAVVSLCRLAICSVKEDTMGKVQNDIAELTRVLTRLSTSLDALLAGLQPHWTDVYCERKAPEVSALTTLVKAQLGEVLEVFGEYAEQIGLSRLEYRRARDAANAEPETKVVGKSGKR